MYRIAFNYLTALLGCVGLTVLGYIAVQFLPKDHLIEERIEDALEDLIEDATGAKCEIDFSKD